jgi:hypothetical protein
LMIYPDIDIYSPPGIHGWIECPTVHRPE